MDSQDSTAQPSHLHRPHRPLSPPPSHPASVLLGPHSQSQKRLPNDSYPLANSNNAVNSTPTIMHQQNPGLPFNSILAGGGPKPSDHLRPDRSSSGGRGDGSGLSRDRVDGSGLSRGRGDGSGLSRGRSDGSDLSRGRVDGSGPSMGRGDGSGPLRGRGDGSCIVLPRKKRGRARIPSPDSRIAMGPPPAPVFKTPSHMAQDDSAAAGSGGAPSSGTSSKRNRDRPSSSVQRQMGALGVPGVGFTPYVITVNAGEDIAKKITSCTPPGPPTFFVLSAIGVVSNATLRHLMCAGKAGHATYEGRLDIISLSGLYGNHIRNGSLSISLAGPKGQVLGGVITGVVTAAGQVQVIIGSFIARLSLGGSSETGEENDGTRASV